ncbi:hypothetical protein [Glycomyces buryatensis]|uniref:Sulfotransferase family protein n=1 Tax=Glycomyces buryatensis TaxID=2570927 RepID=A0A4V4HRB8_9ACTN|nr:hypothetical protein [Glycomyces buryatensis]THV37096.1 hypothetical protein FAB82_21375 [Glycomyces buryatensis]
MRVFVLSTGRCGSVTFSTACGYLSNFSAGHESRYKLVGDERFAFPDEHIEVDNRLTWFLGRLAREYDGTEVLYVHLRRDPEAVAQSFLRRWGGPQKASIIRAYAHGMLQRGAEWPEERRIEVCRDYVETVNTNIEAFIARRPSMTIWLDQAADRFPLFLDRIGAEGDLEAAVGEFQTVHNASV